MEGEREKRYAFAVGHTKPLEKTHPHLKGFVEFLDDFNRETERGAALAAAAFLDTLLERVLVAFLIQNDSNSNLTKGFNAPLGTFSARIAACHAMGLISEQEFRKPRDNGAGRNKLAVIATGGDPADLDQQHRPPRCYFCDPLDAEVCRRAARIFRCRRVSWRRVVPSLRNMLAQRSSTITFRHGERPASVQDASAKMTERNARCAIIPRELAAPLIGF